MVWCLPTTFPACVYSGPCILHVLTLPFQPEVCGIKLKVVLKWIFKRDIYIENTGVVSLISGVKIVGSLKIKMERF